MLTVLFLTFLVLLLINMPIAFALGIAAAVALVVDPVLPLNGIVTRAFVGVDSFTLLAIPFFILASTFMSTGGVAKRIIRFSIATIRDSHWLQLPSARTVQTNYIQKQPRLLART